MESRVDTELSVQRITRIHIHVIACSPAKRLAILYLKPGEIDWAIAPKIQMFARKVTPDDRNQVDLIIERGSSGKIGGSASKGFFFPGKRCLHGIQGYRTNNQNGQLFQPSMINVLSTGVTFNPCRKVDKTNDKALSPTISDQLY